MHGSRPSKRSSKRTKVDFIYIKALHIIFIVTWFSGMFYQVRLFIYHREADDKDEPEKSILKKQFQLMSKRLLFGITWPSAILTLIFGLLLLRSFGEWPSWLNIKLIMVVGLYLYHFSIHWIYKLQAKGDFRFSSFQLRIWNELATIFLVAIVMLAIVKDNVSLVFGLGGLVVFTLIIYSAVKIRNSFKK